MRVVAKNFGWRHAGRKNPALRNINLHIEPGERVLVLGPSGAGKSTLLAAIAGVLGDDQDGDRNGSVTVDGRDPRQHKGLVGMVLQDPDSQVIASHVGDDVVFGCENMGVPQADMWDRAADALALVGLDLPMDHPTAKLSGGQKQRLALAGVIAMQPGVIVLDEPTANLDPQGVHDVRDAVIRAADATGATVIVVEHRVETWARHMHRVIVVDHHDIAWDGPTQEILQRHAEQLVDAGMWVPGIPLDIPPLPPAPQGEAVAEFTELGVGWDHELRRINGTLQPGSTVLTGINGAGKSTTALTIGGLLAPVSGQVTFTGFPGQPHRWRSRDLVQRIGYVFQDPEHQFMARTVRDELLLGPKTAHMDAEQATQRIDYVLDQLRLRHLDKANPFTLSGGEKRRLSVATMLATNPHLVIIDEPTFGQDRDTFTAMVNLLRAQVEQGTHLLSISHSEDYMALMAQHTWELA